MELYTLYIFRKVFDTSFKVASRAADTSRAFAPGAKKIPTGIIGSLLNLPMNQGIRT